MGKILIPVLVLLLLSVKNTAAVDPETKVYLHEASETGLVKNINPFSQKTEEIMGRLDFEVKSQQKILEKITLRLNKIREQGIKKDNIETNLSSLTDKVSLLQKEYSKLASLAESLYTSLNLKKDYQAFRKQYQTVIKIYKDIVQTEKNLMINIKKLTEGKVNPSISIKPE